MILGLIACAAILCLYTGWLLWRNRALAIGLTVGSVGVVIAGLLLWVLTSGSR